MLDVKPAVLNHKDVDYLVELGTIRSTFLGKEGHGIFTFVLEMDFGGSRQGAGTYALNDPATFGKFIQGLLNFFGGSWEQLLRRQVFVLRENPYGTIRGLMNTAQTEVLIFSDLSD